MMLMMPLALARRGLGVMSGMRATAGLRYIIIKMRTMAIIATIPAMLLLWKNSGINGNATAETNVPTRMYGMRLPIFVCVLSERRPKSGRRMSAARLSHAMMMPTIHCTCRMWFGSLALRSADDMP